MPRGVDVDLFHPSHRDTEDGIFRLGYVRRLVREKNLGLLIELERALVNSRETRYRFVIVGHGDERPWLERNLVRAEFTGVLHGEHLARAYANMDLFVFPSRADAFGNIVQEALAAGTPAFVTDQGGPKYLVNSGVTGFVAGSEREFIERAISFMAEPGTHRGMRAAARQAACSASWDRVFEGVWQSYEICLRLLGRRAALVREKPLGSENVA
jgi:glycosyltransferase involved in cell wall biosynthesis